MSVTLLIIPGALKAQSLSRKHAVPVLNAPTFVQAHQPNDARTVSGVIISAQNELVSGVTVLARTASGEQRTLSDAEGNFRLSVPDGDVTLRFFGRGIALVSKTIGTNDPTVDLYVSKRLRRFVDLNFAVDNLFNKRYFETQNFFESRLRPGADPVERIHATPGYPFGVTVGFTFRFGEK